MSDVALGAGLVLGLAGGLHCVGMCGAVSGWLAAPRAGEAPDQARAYATLGAYNAGRLVAYASLGAVVGWLGRMPDESGPLRAASLGVRLVAALALVGVGLGLLGVRSLRWTSDEGGGLRGSVGRLVRPLVARFSKVRSPATAALLGLAWALVPCGLLYAALALSLSSGDAASGAASMGAFALGTMPAMMGSGALVRTFGRLGSERARGLARRGAGALVLASGAFFVLVALSAYRGGGLLPAPIEQALGIGPRSCCAHGA